MSENATARLSVMMTPSQKESLEKRAAEAGLTVSELVRQAVTGFDPAPANIMTAIHRLESRLKAVELDRASPSSRRKQSHA